MDGLLPAATLRAEPPGQMRAGSVVTRLALAPGIVPLCSYVRVQRLQRSCICERPVQHRMNSLSAAAHSHIRLCRPAVGLPCWAIGAEPEDLLTALQPYFVRKVPMLCIARAIPLCQDGSHFRILALCKGWVLVLSAAFSICFCTLWAASLILADPVTRCCTPLMATDTTEPTNFLNAMCHHAVRCTSVCFIVPLSCKQGSLGSSGVVLAPFAAAARGTTTAIAPVSNSCLPAVQVAIWALITHPPNFPASL